MPSDYYFTDRKGRNIVIRGWDSGMSAFHNGKKIGEMSFDEWNDFTIMSFVSVDSHYQGAGIGSEMMKNAVVCVGDFLVPGRTWNERRDDGLHTSIEGRALIKSCLKNGIISAEQQADFYEWATPTEDVTVEDK